MRIKVTENENLASHTMMRVGGPARFFSIIRSKEELLPAALFARERNIPIFVLGEGSNIVVSDKGLFMLVLTFSMKNVSFSSMAGKVQVTAASGGSWDDLVEDTVSKGLYGTENLSLIPGMVGAAPIQNIGAYGQEIADVIEAVRVFDTERMKFATLTKSECAFQYRESIFKKKEGSHFIVTEIVLSLPERGELRTDYKDVRSYFDEHKDTEPTLKTVRHAVCTIRRNKLPDIKRYGTVGSFFKNPIIKNAHYQKLLKKFPSMPGFKSGEYVKVPLAWIIENVCGMKGIRRGAVGVYGKHALVLVHYGGGTARDVKKFAEEIREEVKEKTDILPEYEVSFVGQF